MCLNTIKAKPNRPLAHSLTHLSFDLTNHPHPPSKMYKLVVFATLWACAAAAPGLIGAPYGIAAPLASPWGHGLVGAPLVSAPVVKTVAPLATSYANSVRIASPTVAVAAHAPAYASYAAPAYAASYAAPAYAHGW